MKELYIGQFVWIQHPNPKIKLFRPILAKITGKLSEDKYDIEYSTICGKGIPRDFYSCWLEPVNLLDVMSGAVEVEFGSGSRQS